ncbi:restriction endonuclease [Streptomyces sp. ISL-43]|uniref:restriction endonuclease n=1 Tax=Streptomyces sp. ISL-43 TaxID=2819183 RepID=UPI001BE55785|nr:restriction endonuclease [Streptomyces sp. ISL-43]MBT2448336.1 restriction endonuclease [Streptomyces sp. ISL-43]
MKNTGESFESYVQFVYQTLLGAQGRNISVSRRATVFDNHGNSYNIDIFYEFDVAGLHHRVAIECKDTRRPVERDDAIAFAGKIRDLPSTIGIFISKSGFQPAARKYLQDHGIVHYAGGDLPHLGNVIAAMISPIACPAESAVGQPFWTLMRQENGEATGEWCLIPDPNDPRNASGTERDNGTGAFPLFYSRPHAESFRTLRYQDSADVCVRGVEQSMLRFLTLMAHDERRNFAICLPFADEHGAPRIACHGWTAQDLAHEYWADEVPASFDNPPRG